jgi:hypothetical protein
MLLASFDIMKPMKRFKSKQTICRPDMGCGTTTALLYQKPELNSGFGLICSCEEGELAGHI